MTLQINGSSLFYTKQGHGKKNLILFHGFGQDHSVFQAIIDRLSDIYTCYAFDIYFHGESTWAHNETPLTKTEWKESVVAFLKINDVDSFSLLGYSLGGKFIFAALEAFPERINEVFLIAPDGIKTSSWYSLATYPFFLRNIFRSMIDKESRFFKTAAIVNSLGLLNKGILRFAESQMNTKDKRARVYYSWVVFRRLKFKMKEIAILINTYNIPLIVILGKFDKVIRKENMNKLLKHVDEFQLEVLEAGHNHLLGDETAELIIQQQGKLRENRNSKARQTRTKNSS